MKPTTEKEKSLIWWDQFAKGRKSELSKKPISEVHKIKPDEIYKIYVREREPGHYRVELLGGGHFTVAFWNRTLGGGYWDRLGEPRRLKDSDFYAIHERVEVSENILFSKTPGTKARLFEILDVINVADGENGTANIGVCPDFQSANYSQSKGGTLVTMGVPNNVVFDIESQKLKPILLMVNMEEYEKVKSASGGK